MKSRMSFERRVAEQADAQEIAALVNRAYRPSPQEAGWTHEAHLVAGERTTPEQVHALFHPQSTILLLSLGSRIVACVHVEDGPSGAYIGMLATDPQLQAQGLGKQMLLHAEAYACEHFGASVFKMSVLSSRPELLAFYHRRGYALTGQVEDYPLSAGVGQPMVSGIQVLSLEKCRPTHFAEADKSRKQANSGAVHE